MKWQDVVIVVGFIMYLGAGFATQIIISEVATITGYAEAAIQLESNPIARVTLNYRYGMLITQALAIAFFGGIYYVVRRMYVKAPPAAMEQHYLLLSFYTIAMFLMFLQNFMNDFSIFIGIMGGI